LEAKEEKVKKEVADAFLQAYNYVMEKGKEEFGESFTEQLMVGPYYETVSKAPSRAEQTKKLKELVDREVKVGKEVESFLNAVFAFSPRIRKKINRILYYYYPSFDPETGELTEVRSVAPALGQLATYLLNGYLTAEGMPTFLYRERTRGTTTQPFSFNKIRQQVLEALTETEYQKFLEDLEKRAPELKDKVYKWLHEKGYLTKEEMETVLKYIPKSIVETEVPEPETVTASTRKQALYDIEVGDEIVDPQYGKGKVIDTSNLNEGFVEVVFGPNIKIANYNIEKIAQPYYTELPEFQCPIDRNWIVAETCLGTTPDSSCSFLKFIDGKATCAYVIEMNKIVEAANKAKEEKQALETQKNKFYQEIKAQLAEILKTASFNDHECLEIIKHTPITLLGYVKKANAPHYGTVVSKNLDGSLNVKWASGEKTVNWEIELTGISKKAWFEFVLEKLRKHHEEVEKLVKDRVEGKLRAEAFVAAVNALRDKLGLQGISEPDFLQHFWDVARELGLHELYPHTVPASPPIPVYELPDEGVLEEVRKKFPEKEEVKETAQK